jgi:Na+-driven multidrug efflux pump
VFLNLFIASPVILILWFLGENLLRFFGESYINMNLLHILLVSTVPFLFNSIGFVFLRVHRKDKYLILFSLMVIISSTVLAFHFSSLLGIVGIGVGWLSGQTLSSVALGIIFGFNVMRRKYLA